MRTANYREEASSSERTCALVARLRARVQSPSRLADCASPINCLIFVAKSDWVAFSVLPCERARFFSASLMLEVICCLAAEASASDICGAITGASGLSAVFSAAGAGAIRGRAGAVRTASSGGGGGSSNCSSGTGSTLSSGNGRGLGAVIVAGTTGRESPAPRQETGAGLRSAHPEINSAAQKQNTRAAHA
jgi:hypothetical protein